MLGLLEKKKDDKAKPFSGQGNWALSAGNTVTYLPVTEAPTFQNYTMQAEQMRVVEQRMYVEQTRTLRNRIIKVLAGADSAIREHGWMQGAYYRQDKGFCLHGALQYAASGVIPSGQWSWTEVPMGGGDCAAFNAAVQVLHSLINSLDSVNSASPRFLDIPSWNDFAGRTVEDVHMLLKAGIERVETLYQ